MTGLRQLDGRRPAADKPIIAVEHLSVEYGPADAPVRAVSDVSLAVYAGEIVGVVGESGSGKSTMGRALLRLLPAAGRITAGRITLATGEHDIDLTTVATSKLRSLRGTAMGLVPQATSASLNPVLTCEQHFRKTYRAHRRISTKESRAQALAALAAVGLPQPDQVLELYPHELSGGMAQRVIVALANAHHPALLVADEPTSALDVTVQRALLDELSAAVTAQRSACLLITHDLGVVANYCDRVIVMYAGEIVDQGTVVDVLSSPGHPFTELLLNSMPGAATEFSSTALPAQSGGS